MRRTHQLMIAGMLLAAITASALLHFGVMAVRPAQAHRLPIALTPASTFTCPFSREVGRIVPTPNAGAFENGLSGILRLAANDSWAVGGYFDGTNEDPLIEHWDGASWQMVASPPIAGYLQALAAVSATDVWAVGYRYTGFVDVSLIEHWNGTTWSIVPTPNGASYNNSLFSVTAVSASDIWAVGTDNENSAPIETLIEHWDGASWSIVASPNPSTSDNFLYGVVANSSTDVWAVGSAFTAGMQPITEHWTGSSWAVVPTPTLPQPSAGELLAAVALSPSSVWAVGYDGFPLQPDTAVVEHWDGATWSLVPNPTPVGSTVLTAIAATSATNVWVSGSVAAIGSTARQPFAAHWDGASWTQASSPNAPVSSDPYFPYIPTSIALISPTSIWAVESTDNQQGASSQTLLVDYSPRLLGLNCPR